MQLIFNTHAFPSTAVKIENGAIFNLAQILIKLVGLNVWKGSWIISIDLIALNSVRMACRPPLCNINTVKWNQIAMRLPKEHCLFLFCWFCVVVFFSPLHLFRIENDTHHMTVYKLHEFERIYHTICHVYVDQVALQSHFYSSHG